MANLLQKQKKSKCSTRRPASSSVKRAAIERAHTRDKAVQVSAPTPALSAPSSPHKTKNHPFHAHTCQVTPREGRRPASSHANCAAIERAWQQASAVRSSGTRKCMRATRAKKIHTHAHTHEHTHTHTQSAYLARPRTNLGAIERAYHQDTTVKVPGHQAAVQARAPSTQTQKPVFHLPSLVNRRLTRAKPLRLHMRNAVQSRGHIVKSYKCKCQASALVLAPSLPRIWVISHVFAKFVIPSLHQTPAY